MTSHSGPRKILVAVDFGTTFSGVAWAETRRKIRTIVKDWPSGGGSDDKVPTKLQYDSATFGDGRAWGFEVEPDSNKTTYELFKLGLDPQQEKETKLARDYPSVVKLPNNSTDIEQLVVDYLSALRESLEQRLDSLPNSMDMRSMPREYIITVPAVWSDRAQARTRSCAERAGMGDKDKIGIIAEPEAAAIHVLDELRAEDYNYELGDTFVVCDAGGGTVDLISYTVTGLKPLLVKEATKGDGYVCGGMFVNRVFARYLRQTYGNDPSWSDDVLEDAVRAFEENVKKRFDGRLDKSYSINIGIQNHRPGIAHGKLRLSGEQIKGFFDPVVAEIEKLVLAQIRTTTERVKSVILVGGFGGNKYLFDKLQKAVGDGIKVSKPKNTTTAVVEGALVRALAEARPSRATIRVETRNARRYYGTSSYKEFIPGVHDRSKMEPDEYQGKPHISTLQWFVKQNEPVREAKPFGYYWDKKVSEGKPKEIKMSIFSFEASNNMEPPIYPDAAGVRELGVLKVKIADLDDDAVPKKKGDNDEEFYVIDFDIQMTLHSANLTFALLVKGKKYHELSLDFS